MWKKNILVTVGALSLSAHGRQALALCHLHQRLCTFWPTYYEQLVHQYAMMMQIAAHLLQLSCDTMVVCFCQAGSVRLWLYTCEWRHTKCVTRTPLCILWIISCALMIAWNDWLSHHRQNLLSCYVYQCLPGANIIISGAIFSSLRCKICVTLIKMTEYKKSVAELDFKANVRHPSPPALVPLMPIRSHLLVSVVRWLFLGRRIVQRWKVSAQATLSSHFFISAARKHLGLQLPPHRCDRKKEALQVK